VRGLDSYALEAYAAAAVALAHGGEDHASRAQYLVAIDGRSRDYSRIETGDYLEYALGEDAKTAVIAAFEKRAPRNPAASTWAKTGGRAGMCVSTAEMLALAGRKWVDDQG